jgi:riboflavin synthase
VFTGIVREQGSVAAVEARDRGVRLVIEAPLTAGATALGDSIAVDGVCLTATEIRDGHVAFDAVAETLSRSTLGALVAGSDVNLEPAVRAGEPLGGHYVQGHVDGVGEVRRVERDGDGLRVWIDATPDLLRYCVEKGSIAVQGVSLTIAELADDAFAVALIPHTLAVTTLGGIAIGDRLNLEVDVLAKYVERLVAR